MQTGFVKLLLTDEIIRAVLWTLLHSLWQGLLIAIGAVIIIMFTKKSGSAIRHNLLSSLFLLFLLAACVTFYWQLHTPSKFGTDSPSAAANIKQPETFSLYGNTGLTDSLLSDNFLDKAINYFNNNASWLVAIWFILFSVKCIRLFTNLAYIQRIRNYKIHSPEEYWINKLQALIAKLQIKRTISLLESELVKVPLAIGHLKPVILIPLGLLSSLPPGEVEAILLHELAHIRRKDYLINLILSFGEIIFFFNPAILWLSSLIREERENCCDDIALAHSGNKANYIQALISFQEYHLSAPRYATALSGTKNHLLKRVKRIINNEHKKLNSMEKGIFIFSVATIGFLSFLSMKEPTGRIVKDITIVPKQYSIPLGERPATRWAFSQNDTLPSKLRFPSISSNINKDGDILTSTFEATDQNGTKYKMVKKNDELTELYVDGKRIPENNLLEYKEIVNSIQESVIFRNADEVKRDREAELNQETRLKLMQEKMNRLNEEQTKMALAKMNALQQDQWKRDREFEMAAMQNEKLNELKSELRDREKANLVAGRQSIEQRIKDLEELRNQNMDPQKADEVKMEKEKLYESLIMANKRMQELQESGWEGNPELMAQMKRRQEFMQENQGMLREKLALNEFEKQKIMMEKAFRERNDRSMEEGRKIVGSLIQDLINAKLIKNEKNLDWFALTDEELIVNGKKQSPALQNELKEKYITTPGFGIYYGNVPISGKGIFFKKEKP